MQLSDLTADELRNVRAPLLRARKRILSNKVVPLRVASRSGLASIHAPGHGLIEPTIDELFAELERRAGDVGR
jgi:hypothetical protein